MVADVFVGQVVRMLKSDELNEIMAAGVGDVRTAASDGITGVAKAGQEAVSA